MYVAVPGIELAVSQSVTAMLHKQLFKMSCHDRHDVM